MTESTMIVHAGGHYVTRDELRKIPTPAPMGRFHKPIPHIEFVETIDRVLGDRGIAVKRERLAVNQGGAHIFGTLDFDPASPGLVCTDPTRGHSMGVAGANNQSLKRKLAVGGRIFICDNLAFAPGLISLEHKQTTGFDFAKALDDAMTTFIAQTRDLDAMIERAQGTVLGDDQAKVLIFDAFTRHKVASVRLMPEVSRLYFDTPQEPGYEDISGHPRTLWALHNAFTREFRRLVPQTHFQATAKLGGLLALGSTPSQN